MESLRRVVEAYAAGRADRDGRVETPVEGLRIMYVDSPRGALHSTYRPLICLVLQGAKRLSVGREERVVSAGQSIIVSADMPVIGTILQPSAEAPYLAVAVELDMGILRETGAQLDIANAVPPSGQRTLFVQATDRMALDCAERLLRLIDRPGAVPLLRPGILRELCYWLLTGPDAAQLRALADVNSHWSRLAAAIAILRAEFRSRVPVERLAVTASMSLTAFHKHFKYLTSLTPGQYQKRLRLIEARHLMFHEGASASSAAFSVGYESVSQFTREYRRMFNQSPKRDVRGVGTESVVTVTSAG